MRRRRARAATAATALAVVLAACGSTVSTPPTPSASPSESLRPPATAFLSVGPPPPDAMTTAPFATSTATPRAIVPPDQPPVPAADCARLAAHRSDRAADLALALAQDTDPAAFGRDTAAARARWARELPDVRTALVHDEALGDPTDPLVADLQAWQAALQKLLTDADADGGAGQATTFRSDYVAVQSAFDQWTFDVGGRCG